MMERKRYVVQYWHADKTAGEFKTLDVGQWRAFQSHEQDQELAINAAKQLSAARNTHTRVLIEIWRSEGKG